MYGDGTNAVVPRSSPCLLVVLGPEAQLVAQIVKDVFIM